MSKQRSEDYTMDDIRKENEAMYRKILKDLRNEPVKYGIILALIGLVFGAILFHHEPDWQANNLFSFFTNFGTEVIGIIVTVFIVNAWQDRRTRKLAQELRKNELLTDVKYGTNVDAVRAINRIRQIQTREGGQSLLAGENLYEAQLSDANLERFDLQGATFRKASLTNAKLGAANLTGTYLIETNLRHASLIMAQAKNADFTEANLENADLTDANLDGAILHGANLRGAKFDLEDANLTERTVLPDSELFIDNWFNEGSRGHRRYNSYYDPAKGPKQLERFTNPDHPEFWDPCKELSERPWYCKEDNTNAS